jgi:hypothetical protein
MGALGNEINLEAIRNKPNVIAAMALLSRAWRGT